MNQEVKIQLSLKQIEALRDGDMLTISISSNHTSEEQEEQNCQTSEKGGSFFTFFNMQIARLHEDGKIRTCEIYRATLGKLRAFRNDEDLSPTQINTEMIESFQAFLRAQNLSMNSISFYNRVVRAVYHRAVEQGLTIDRQPFRHVYTGHAKTNKRALTIDEIKRIKHVSLSDAGECFARDMFLFSFYTRGMAFVDMANLKKTDLSNGVLHYKRKKTGQNISIRWEPSMQEIVSLHVSQTHYLLPIIHTADSTERNQYRNVQNRVNKLLKIVASKTNVTQSLSMYWARHSWATIAREHKLPISVISHGLGHSNERTTEIYLKSIDISVIDKCNHEIISLLD